VQLNLRKINKGGVQGGFSRFGIRTRTYALSQFCNDAMALSASQTTLRTRRFRFSA